MVFSCFFCQKPLVPFKDEKRSGNYSSHWACYECGDTNSRMDSIEIRRCHYFICAKEGGVRTASLFFRENKIWVEIFYFEENAFTAIREDNWIPILRLPQSLDLEKYTPETLEDKIKIWTTFS